MSPNSSYPGPATGFSQLNAFERPLLKRGSQQLKIDAERTNAPESIPHKQLYSANVSNTLAMDPAIRRQ